MCELSALERNEKSVLKWFGHKERMGEERWLRGKSGGLQGEREAAKKMKV